MGSSDSSKRVVSIHAPARGATPPGPHRIPAAPRFNPRAREGRDYNVDAQRAIVYKFQSTRPRGARLALGDSRSLLSSRFNPRAREGRDKYIMP